MQNRTAKHPQQQGKLNQQWRGLVTSNEEGWKWRRILNLGMSMWTSRIPLNAKNYVASREHQSKLRHAEVRDGEERTP